MNEERKKTPINTMRDFDINTRLTSILQQAYHRRSRNLPANLNDIVETLKGDLLKAYPDVPIEVVDDAIVIETLHNPNEQLSPTFFFNAVKKAWFTPKSNAHQWDGRDEDLAYWQDLANRHPWDTHAAEMVEHYRHGDTEQDTISLLDTCASMLAKMDEAEANGQTVAKKAEFKGVVVDLPAFNSRREYCYLVMRGQLAVDAWTHHFADALLAINTERMESHHHMLTKEEAAKNPDVLSQARRLAVIDWLRSCNTRGIHPSDILQPLVNENQYQQLRRETA